MKIKYLYLLLCVFGIILPYSQLIPLMLEQNLSFELFFQQLFANRVSTLFALDLFVTATVFLVFTIYEGMKLKVKNLWLPLIATFLVGASLGFPLFLFMRELNIEKSK